jgi:16S rRNA U516 pseudouridylate synthase RsuA-like enzyme
MLEAIGSKVSKLVRTAIGPLEIAGLQVGAHRELTPAEVGTLLKITKARPRTNRDSRA